MIRTRQRGGRRDDAAQEALARTVAVLQGYERAGAATVPVADMLAMLGASAEAGTETGPAPAVPGTDPLTGCMSVSPRP